MRLLVRLYFNYCIFSSGGIFGHQLAEILRSYPDLSFLFEWLNRLKKLHDAHNLESFFDRYEEYLKLKLKINLEPMSLPTDLDDEFLYRLVYDFFQNSLKEFTIDFLAVLTELDGID